MIFAHGPLGYLVARATQRFWDVSTFSQRQRSMLWLVGFIAGIFPDIDLFYYYLIDAEHSHRALPTHTPLFYLVTCAVLYILARWRGSVFFRAAIFVAFWGFLSHLFADGIFAQVQYMRPFSVTYFGLSDIVPDYIHPALLAINFILEGTIIALFLYVLIRTHVERWSIRIPLVALLLSVYTCGVAVVYLGNSHVAHLPLTMYYDDLDRDGIMNIHDRDMDGDGVVNIDDVDSDNDGESNPFEVAQFASSLIGVWYDPTHGGLIQIPARLGLLTTIDAPRVVLDSAGISLRAEMMADYAVRSDGYVTTPKDNQFDRSIQNIRAWLDHQGRLQTYAEGRDQIGDILFFEDGYVVIVVGFDNEGQATVLDVSPHRPIKERFLRAVIEDEGEVVLRGKLLNSAPINP